tara:strand:+ start:6380 stop:7309 length:930 start_codon:yes stop_codon:yes gene_type:complete
MNIVITGGSGLIAGRLANSLSKNHTITLLSKKNISSFFNHPNILVKKYKNISELTEIFVNQDAIIYTSGPNSADCKNDYLVQKYIKETDDIIKILAENKTVEKFLFLSSIRVISDDCEGLITEESVCNPTTNYGRVKNTIEKNLLNLNKIDGLNRIILRITNGYGFPAHKLSDCWSLVVMDICKQAVINKKIELRSDGQVYKDFIPISTITDTIENIITDENLKPVEIFNVSSGISVKVIDLINKIKKILEQKLSYNLEIQINKASNGKSIPKMFSVDNTKIVDRGYMSHIDNDCEINHLIDYCIKNFR